MNITHPGSQASVSEFGPNSISVEHWSSCCLFVSPSLIPSHELQSHCIYRHSESSVSMLPRNEDINMEAKGLFRVNWILYHKMITLFGGKKKHNHPYGNLMVSSSAISTIQTHVLSVKLRINAKWEPKKERGKVCGLG